MYAYRFEKNKPWDQNYFSISLSRSVTGSSHLRSQLWLYANSEQVEFKHQSKSQLQQEDTSYNEEPTFTCRLNVVSEVEGNKCSRHEASYTSDNPSNDFLRNNR